MKREFITRVAILGAGILLSGRPALAADCNTNGTDDALDTAGTVVFDQLGLAIDAAPTNFVSDDANTAFAGAQGRITADDFSTAVANTVINQVTLRGFSAPAKKFIVKIWSNNPTGFAPPPAGVVGCSAAGDPGDGSTFPDNPGAVIYSEVMPADRVLVSAVPGDPTSVFDFEFNLSASVTLATAGRYWLEVYYNDPADTINNPWGWTASSNLAAPGAGSNMRRSHTCPTMIAPCGQPEIWSRANNFQGRFAIRRAEIDRNNNNVPDVCDDCNTNNTPDHAESYADCNSNFNPDVCDGPDCNTNGTLDACDAGDCNLNGTPDACDISGASSTDVNTNNTPDDCEFAGRWCLKGDMNFDRQSEPGDIPAFVNALLFGSNVPGIRCAADTNLDGRLDGDDIPGFLAVLDSPDSDFDEIPDIYETNNGIHASPIAIGSDPLDPDTDDDGILDGDEVYPTLALLELHGMGANPVRKDLFIEADWFDDATDGPAHSHRPSAGAIAALNATFAAAPVPNPYGASPGVRMHIDRGQGAPYTGGNLIPGGDTVVLFDSELNTYKAANFNSNRQGYFHYMLNCHRYNTAVNNSSGIAELPGNDFIVSLQTFLGDSDVSKTIMHELGHNLNLRHGGFEDRNQKPNYNSVMNYRYQFGGIDVTCNAVGDGVLDYSIGTRISLNESTLNENNGVCGAGFPIDWNASGTFTTPLARNINCFATFSTACGAANANCYDTTCNTLTDYNDWANITLLGPTQGDLRQPNHEWIECPDVPADRSEFEPVQQ